MLLRELGVGVVCSGFAVVVVVVQVHFVTQVSALLVEVQPPQVVQVWMQYYLNTPVMRIFAGRPPSVGLPPLPSDFPSYLPPLSAPGI